MEELNENKWNHIVTVEDLGGLSRKVNVMYDSVGVQRAMENAAKMVSERAAVKGFRKGKAPLQLIKATCKKEIDTATKAILSQNGFFHACNEHRLFVLKEPVFKNAEINDDGTFTCDVFVEVKPDINPTGYIGLQLNKHSADKQKFVDKYLNELKVNHSITTETNVVENESVVTVDYNVVIDGDKVSFGSDHTFLVDGTQDPPFGKNVIGMKLNEVRIEEITMPNEVDKYAGQKASVEMVMKKITNKKQPTDEQLIEMLNLESFDKLLEILNKKADEEATMIENSSLEEQAMDRLLEMHEFEVPKDWISDEYNYISKQLGFENSDEKTGEFLVKMAERNVKRTFVLDAIYNEEPSLALTNDEINEFLKLEANVRNVSSLVLKEELKKNNMLDSFIAAIKHKKVLNFILSSASIITENQEG